MKPVFRIVASLDLLQSLEKLRQMFEEIRSGRWDTQNDVIVLSAIVVHLDIMGNMDVVLVRMRGLANDLALVADDRPQRAIPADMNRRRYDKLAGDVCVVAFTVN